MASEQQPTEQKKRHGSHHGCKEADGLTGSVPPRSVSDVVGDDGTTDSQQCRDDEAAWITAGQENLGDNTDEKADENGDEHIEYDVGLAKAGAIHGPKTPSGVPRRSAGEP